MQFDVAQNELKNTATAYVDADGFKFSRAANELRENLRTLSPSVYPQDRQLRLEYFYNHLDAFYSAIWLYGIGFLVLVIAHLRKRGPALSSIGITLAVVGLTFHASGIVMRCLIAG